MLATRHAVLGCLLVVLLSACGHHGTSAAGQVDPSAPIPSIGTADDPLHPTCPQEVRMRPTGGTLPPGAVSVRQCGRYRDDAYVFIPPPDVLTSGVGEMVAAVNAGPATVVDPPPTPAIVCSGTSRYFSLLVAYPDGSEREVDEGTCNAVRLGAVQRGSLAPISDLFDRLVRRQRRQQADLPPVRVSLPSCPAHRRVVYPAAVLFSQATHSPEQMTTPPAVKGRVCLRRVRARHYVASTLVTGKQVDRLFTSTAPRGIGPGCVGKRTLTVIAVDRWGDVFSGDINGCTRRRGSASRPNDRLLAQVIARARPLRR